VVSVVGDSIKAHKILGWSASTQFQKMIERMINFDLSLIDSLLARVSLGIRINLRAPINWVDPKKLQLGRDRVPATFDTNRIILLPLILCG
jgi:hypothetical protein